MRRTMLLILSLFFSTWLFSQEKQHRTILSGNVINQAGNLPIEGVNVQSAIAGKKVSTDQYGHFSIEVESKIDTINFSHINFRNRSMIFRLGDRVNLAIRLEPNGIVLQDVNIVNTGFQKLPKERSTGSFAQIDNKLYNEQAGSSILERLTYIANGVSPIATERVSELKNSGLLIRGLSTFTYAVQKPLIIVDNFEYQGSIDNLNPNDIDNVTILKDAAAGSIWGARAANGVIVITTKKGRFSSGVGISFNSNISISEKPDLMNIPSISGTNLVGVEEFLFSQKYRFSDTARSTHPSFSPVYEILFAKQAGKLSPAEAEAQLNKLKGQDVRESYSKNFYRKAVAQQYALSISGGSNALAWVASGGYDRNINALFAGNDRLTLRNSSKVKLNKAITLDIDLNFVSSTSSSGKPSYGSIKPSITALPAYSQFSDEQGNEIPLYLKYRQSYLEKTFGSKILSYAYNPLSDYLLNTTGQELQDVNATLGINYKINQMINIDVKYRYEKQDLSSTSYFDENSFFARDLTNNYTQINPVTGAVTYKIPQGAIIDKSNSSLQGKNLRGQLNFSKPWKTGEINFLAGSEINEVINNSAIDRTYGYRPAILTYVNMDYANSYPGLFGGSGFIPTPKGFTATNNRFLSLFVNGSYSLLRRYTFSGSMRRDASNLFGANTNNKWKPLWSVGMAWDASKEKFISANWLEKLKIRTSYGMQGNIDPTQVAVATFSYPGTNPFTQMPYSVINNYPNPDLTWEQVKMLNLGADFILLKGRISGSLEVYKKHLENLFASVPIDRTTGISSGSVRRNVGEAKGTGVDIQVRGLITTGRLRWSSDLIFNTYRDRVTKLNAPPVLGSGSITSGFLILQGYTPSALLSYKWAGLDPQTGDPLGFISGAVSKDYSAIRSQTRLEDVAYSGSQLPTVFGSWGNELHWKNLSLSVRVIYKLGYYFRRSSVDYGSLLLLAGHSDFARRWQKPGDEEFTNVPSFLYPVNTARDEFYSFSDILVEKGDQIRLQYINLSYTLSKADHPIMPFENIQVYGIASNLGILWRANKKGLDPDFPELRSPRQYTLGLRIQY